ncbi:MAG: hypothetical protein LBD02_01360 [Christensenellaceae bacterium]|jgi:hypothetical protein|nr:hypothetical protein [Christensenellaceae bacterium]
MPIVGRPSTKPMPFCPFFIRRHATSIECEHAEEGWASIRHFPSYKDAQDFFVENCCSESGVKQCPMALRIDAGY